MATTTPNFGWPVPTSTDLVKDGATAMEALGDAIDTSMVDLKGGTTGQVLAKASNTDMDFSWVAQDDSNAIQNTIVDAKGDLIAASAADTPARLAVGNNGETLVADSSTSTGLRYQAPKSVNGIINSNFSVWQRGTSNNTTALAYTADRWQRGGNTHYGVSRTTVSDTTNLPFIQYAARIQRTAGSTNTGIIDIAYSMETVDAIKYAGRTVTFSIYARKGANYSGGNMEFSVYTGTGTDQSIMAGGYTGITNSLAGSTAITTSMVRYQATATLPTNLTELALYISYTPTGTAGAADYIDITGIQLESGSVATPYAPYSGTIQGELAACQRYYIRYGGDIGNQIFGFGTASSTTTLYANWTFPVTMRVPPTSVEYSTLAVQDTTGSNAAVTSVVTSNPGKGMTWIVAGVASGLTQFRPYYLTANGSTNAYLGLSAEL